MWCVSSPDAKRKGKLRSEINEPVARNQFNILILGAHGVGKTALCSRLFTGRAPESADLVCDLYNEKFEDVDGEIAVMKLEEDTATFTRKIPGSVQTALRQKIENGHGFILVYSVTDRRSLSSLHQMFTFVQHVKRGKDFPIVLVGNKMDVGTERCISKEEGQQMAFDLGVSFFESSSRLANCHVTKIFHDLVRQIRCVRTRYEFEKNKASGEASRSGLSGARGIVERLSFRARKKLSIRRQKSQ